MLHFFSHIKNNIRLNSHLTLHFFFIIKKLRFLVLGKRYLFFLIWKFVESVHVLANNHDSIFKPSFFFVRVGSWNSYIRRDLVYIVNNHYPVNIAWWNYQISFKYYLHKYYARSWLAVNMLTSWILLFILGWGPGTQQLTPKELCLYNHQQLASLEK